eukprot:Ihof_evm5s27 gene=Ihof_evmTU5s27
MFSEDNMVATVTSRLQSKAFTISTKGKSQIVAVLNGETHFIKDYKDSGLYQTDLEIIRPLELEVSKEEKIQHTKMAERAMTSVGPKLTHKYIITFTDEFSHFVTVYGLAKKLKAFDCFVDWHLKATAKHNLKMGMLVSNNG